MTPPPARPRLYHITHVDNLSSIIACKALWSDSKCAGQGRSPAQVGMSQIKARRLKDLEVRCHPGTRVGEYVPFYFCPRSIMLYLLYRGNHPDLAYRDGQRPILHLEADLVEVVEWAESQGVHWAFTDCNAGARYAGFYKDLERLDRINWEAVASEDFRDPQIKEGKQAEFLVHQECPWWLVKKIGVPDRGVADQVNQLLHGADYRPVVSVERGWYY